jgi:hypothetical protein
VSKASTAATGASWLPSAPDSLMLGRARAKASKAIAATRSSKSSRCRKRKLRWLDS